MFEIFASYITDCWLVVMMMGARSFAELPDAQGISLGNLAALDIELFN